MLPPIIFAQFLLLEEWTQLDYRSWLNSVSSIPEHIDQDAIFRWTIVVE